MFRRRKMENEGPLRGPGGGRVRRRPLRKERRRRRQGLSDYLLIGLIGGVIVFFVEHYAAKVNWGWSAFAAIVVVVLMVAWSMLLDRWRRRRAEQQRPKR